MRICNEMFECVAIGGIERQGAKSHIVAASSSGGFKGSRARNMPLPPFMGSPRGVPRLHFLHFW